MLIRFKVTVAQRGVPKLKYVGLFADTDAAVSSAMDRFPGAAAISVIALRPSQGGAG